MFGSLYISQIHDSGYAGAPDDYLGIARSGEWTGLAEHFGYFMLLGWMADFNDVLNIDAVVGQGFLSALGAVVALVAVADLSVFMLGSRRTALLAALIFAGSGQIMMTAIYGEPYMLQIAFICVMASAILRDRFGLSAAFFVWAVALAPISVLLTPLPIAAYIRKYGFIVPTYHQITVALIGGIGMAVGLFAIATINDPSFVRDYADYLIIRSGTTTDEVTSIRHIANFVLWFGRGFNLLIPAVAIGAFITLRSRRDRGSGGFLRLPSFLIFYLS